MQRIEAEGPDAALPGDGFEKLARYFDYLEREYPARWKIVDIKYRSVHHLNGFWIGINERPTLLHILQKTTVPIIHLTRKNLLRTLVSGRLAELNRVWHTDDPSSLKTTTIELDTTRLLSQLQSAQSEVGLMTSYLQPIDNLVTVDYQDLFAADGGLATSVGEAIGGLLEIDEFDARRPAFAKQTGSQLDEVIENFAQVRDLLCETEFHWMLD
jgi:hypothetical protein